MTDRPYADLSTWDLQELIEDIGLEKRDIEGRVPYAEWLAVEAEDDVMSEAGRALWEEIFRR